MYLAHIVAIGTELVTGTVKDTNSPFLAEQLARLGFDMMGFSVIRDNREAIVHTLEQSLRIADLVIATGGLGPTFDDVTRAALSEFFGLPLTLSTRQLVRIHRYFRRRGHKPPHPAALTQARLPASARIFDNNFGVAPGFGVPRDRKWVIALPGVPQELEGMFKEKIVPFLNEEFPLDTCGEALAAKIVSLNEVEVLQRIGSRFPPKDRSIECGICPSIGEVVLRMKFVAGSKVQVREKVRHWKRVLIRKLGKYLICFSEDPLEKITGCLLAKRKMTLALAESVTGGLIAKRLTDMPGASRFLRGGVVAYSDKAKNEILGVSKEALARATAVSAQVARAMAINVRFKFGTQWGLSTTGYAGPEADAANRLCGRIFLGVSGLKRSVTRSFRFFGSRDKIRWHASQSALVLLREEILNG